MTVTGVRLGGGIRRVHARAALAMAPCAAALLARELGRDASWQSAQLSAFRDIARHYLPA